MILYNTNGLHNSNKASHAHKADPATSDFGVAQQLGIFQILRECESKGYSSILLNSIRKQFLTDLSIPYIDSGAEGLPLPPGNSSSKNLYIELLSFLSSVRSKLITENVRTISVNNCLPFPPRLSSNILVNGGSFDMVAETQRMYKRMEWNIDSEQVLDQELLSLRSEWPSPSISFLSSFNSQDYSENHKDVAQHNMNPLFHYLVAGIEENRDYLFTGILAPDDANCKILPACLANADEPLISLQQLYSLQLGLTGEAWFGQQAIPKELRYSFHPDFDRDLECDSIERSVNLLATDYIVSTYGIEVEAECETPPISKQSASNARRSCELASKRREFLLEPGETPSLTIITCFYGSLLYLQELATSIETACKFLHSRQPEVSVEWIIVNDDTRVTSKDIDISITPSGFSLCLINNNENLGIVRSSRKALSSASHPWILLCDCDDIISPYALDCALYYIMRFPCRLYSSRIIDIDSFGRVLRYRVRLGNQTNEFEKGLIAGHLQIAHVSLLKELDIAPIWAEGCQDLYRVLHESLSGPLCYIPEYLYSYRWHHNTVSITKQRQQAITARMVKSSFILSDAKASYYALHSSSFNPLTNRSLPSLGIVIRTTGSRINSLIESIYSCMQPSAAHLTTQILVAVHAPKDIADFVWRKISFIKDFDINVSVLCCEKEGTLRGYPLEFGAQYLLKKGVSLIGILDDDDIYLDPYFSLCRRVFNASLGQHPILGLGNSLFQDGSDLPYNQHSLKRPSFLYVENFIPTNSIVISRSAYLSALNLYGEVFPSDMYYLEDYMGLLRLLTSGSSFVYETRYVCEYRGGGDGNATVKRDQQTYDECSKKIVEFKGTYGSTSNSEAFDCLAPLSID